MDREDLALCKCQRQRPQQPSSGGQHDPRRAIDERWLPSERAAMPAELLGHALRAVDSPCFARRHSYAFGYELDLRVQKR